MANDDSFTFCQVGTPSDPDGSEERSIVQNISEIKIEDKSPNGVGAAQSDGILWNDKLRNSATSQKQEKLGSLSFTVIDASAGMKVNASASAGAAEDAGSSIKASQEKKTPTRKPVSRAKVPFEKGYSQMDWMRLTQTHPDLAGLKGQSNKRLISLNEVKQHQTEDSMWTVLKGRVYNIGSYMKFHPGGVDMLMKAVGKDCTFLFNKYHAWVNAEILLEKCLVGILDDSR
ncbi:hypothetical protein M9H77_02581 [Catharanthus roseus]|uniref:Uncharacterized protein n=1 Tax=Catharanthus roseus TaxID=4058 RepID=A0ACC0C8Y4_CATRO|nr:hypothetical protein M9H77_02581 [Catharanthus roseus]